MTDLVLINWKEKLPELPGLKANLSALEIQELSLRRFSDRSLFSRSYLKKLLQERLPGQSIELLSTENGKLFLKDEAYHFSLAHSGDWMAFAFHPHFKIGVDLETWDRGEQILRLSSRYFKPRELSYLEKEPAQKIERALQIWTCKEAWLKAQGSTIFEALEHQEIEINLRDQVDCQRVKFTHQVKPAVFYLTVATTNA